MEAAEYGRMHAIEETYWWHRSRRRLALGLLRRAAPGATRVLDVGCGTGMTLVEAAEQGLASAVGLDPSPLALEACRSRALTSLVQGFGETLPFRDGTFDAVLALDVFEHMADDAEAMREVHRVLAPGGRLIVTVPAFRLLWSVHDEALMHHRRYRRSELVRKLRAAGFDVPKMSYATFFLFPLVLAVRFVQRLLPRRKPSATLPPAPRLINRLLVLLHALENRLILWIGLPVGVSLAGYAVKPGNRRGRPPR